MPTQVIYQIKAELFDYEPKIWRRFQVKSNITIARLGYILMSMFEMKANHLFRFEVPIDLNIRANMEKKYPKDKFEELLEKTSAFDKPEKVLCFDISPEEESFSDDEEESIFDATVYTLNNVMDSRISIMYFNYDFGNDWIIELVLEKIIVDVDKEIPWNLLPRVLEGEGYGIIEDCGGINVLFDIAKAFKKKKGSKYKEYCEWLDVDDFDLSAFDIDDANRRLKKIPRIYSAIYEKGILPTQKSIDFLERKYLK